MSPFTKFTPSGEKNRLHKVLTDGGVRLGVVVSDIHGKSGRLMIRGLLKGETPEQVLRLPTNVLTHLSIFSPKTPSIVP